MTRRRLHAMINQSTKNGHATELFLFQERSTNSHIKTALFSSANAELKNV